MEPQTFQFGSWFVTPADNSITDGQQTRQMEPRAMDVLVALCKKPNSIVSAEELLERCWGSTLYGDNPVHKTIAQLRRLLGDQSNAPLYIETIRKRGYRTIAPVHYDHRQQAQAGTWLNESPFRGLQAFEEHHAPIFFGRSDAIFKLSQVIVNQTAAQNPVELVIILGPSGSGKTSLVRAGLLPALSHKAPAVRLASHSSFDLTERGEHPLLLAVAGMLLDLEVQGVPVFQNQSANSLCDLLQTDLPAVDRALRASLASLSNAQQSAQQSAQQPTHQPAFQQRHALFIDRFEAVFDDKQVDALERHAFLKVLDQLARTRSLLILLACRNDFYPQIATYPLLMEGKLRGAHFDLNPPSQAELAQMIRLPALAAGLNFGVDEQSQLHLDDVLCEAAAGNPDALPLLQYTLHELYRLRTPNNELSFGAFHQLGGIEGAIGQRAEQVIDALSEQQRQCLPHVLSLVVTISTFDAVVTSRRAAWSLLSDDERQVVNALVESRLFVSELVNGASGFGVAHEALLRRWPRVAAWISAHRNALQIRGRIGELAQRWQHEGQSQDLLLPEGKQLDEARGLLGLPTFSLSTVETNLITASIQRARWKRRLRTTALTMIMLLALLAMGLGISALSSKRQALQRRAEVEGLMGFMLGDFADKLRPLGRLDLLDSVGARAISYFTDSDSDDLSDTALTQRAKALQVLAEVRHIRGDPKSAQEALQAANGILLKQQAKTPHNQEVIKNLGTNAFWQGQIHLDKSEWQEAQVFFRRYQTYSNHLFLLNPQNVEWWIEQSYAHNNLGTLALRQRQLHNADQEFQESISLKRRALAKKPGDRNLNVELADSLSWSGSVKEALGQLQAALELYRQEVAIVQEIAQANPGDSLWASKWSTALLHLARIHLALGKDEQALANYRQAEQLLKPILLQEPSNRNWQRNWILLQLAIQQVLSRSNKPEAILPALQEVSNQAHQLALLNPKQHSWRRINAAVLLSIARTLIRTGQFEDSREKIALAQQHLETMLNANSSDTESQLSMAEVLLALAEWENRQQNKTAAQQACQRGRQLLAKEASSSFDYRVLDRWLRLNLCLGEQETVTVTKQRLSQIGYRDSLYLQLMSP